MQTFSIQQRFLIFIIVILPAFAYSPPSFFRRQSLLSLSCSSTCPSKRIYSTMSKEVLTVKRREKCVLRSTFRESGETEETCKNQSANKNNKINALLLQTSIIIGISTRSSIAKHIRTIFKSLAKITSSAMTTLAKSSSACWILLLSAIFVDILSTYITKVASDTKNPSKLVLALVSYLLSQLLFAGSLFKINVGTAYAVYSALGTAVMTMSGFMFFGENCTLGKVLCVGMVVGGVVGLELLDDGP